MNSAAGAQEGGNRTSGLSPVRIARAKVESLPGPKPDDRNPLAGPRDLTIEPRLLGERDFRHCERDPCASDEAPPAPHQPASPIAADKEAAGRRSNPRPSQ